MSIGKSGRNKILGILGAVIILIFGAIFGVNFDEVIPNETTQEEQSQQVTESVTEKPAEVQGSLELTMIDVGQADSFLLEQGEYTALIDCGTRSTGKDVVKYLKDHGITKIDYVFGTHPHDDHMGGMYDVITNFEIGKVVLPKVKSGEVTSNWYLKLMGELSQEKYEVEYAETGQIYMIGDAIMKIIGPINEPSSNLNNYSTVMKISFGEMDIIMTGDAEKSVEADILKSKVDLDAEILKVGHHGSDTSTSTEFLDAINPEYALISAKVGNKYKHPIKETIQNLEKRDIIVYRTDECGTVVATITSNSVEFSTEPGDYLSGTELKEKMQKWKVTRQ